MTLPGNEPSPRSREGHWHSENQTAEPPAAMYPQMTGVKAPTGLYPPPMPYQAPPPRRRTGMWVALGVVTAVLVGLAMWGVIADDRAHPARSRQAGDTKVVIAKDRKSQLTVPSSWTEVIPEHRNELASIQLGDERQGEYIVVITADPTDFEDLRGFADACLDEVRAQVPDIKIGDGHPITVGGLNTVRHEVTGTHGGIKLAYWFTMVEGAHSYYEVVGWTLLSRKDASSPRILSVIDSFQELPD